MNLSAIKAYKDPFANGSSAVLSQSTKISQQKTESSETKLDAKSGTNSGSSVITKKEREFFIKLFPDNTAQIEKHELFNRNGKVTRPSLSKGNLVDCTV